MTVFEALQRLAHRVAISEVERIDIENAFVDAFGNEEEKARFHTETTAEREAREAETDFQAKVDAEIARRNKVSQSATDAAKVAAAADVATATASA